MLYRSIYPHSCKSVEKNPYTFLKWIERGCDKMNKDDKKSKKVECCPDQFPSPQLPSPTDCLPPDELAKVLEQIKDANELLLDLALSEEQPSHESYRKVFDGLIGVQVEITNEQGATVEGVVNFVGYNFIILKDETITVIYPFDKIDKLLPYAKHSEPYPKIKLSEIDPCLRRDLTFTFGKIVAKSPELLHLFFGIRLEKYLLIMEDKKVKVNMRDIIVDGLITDADMESITLNTNGESNVIPIEEVSFITINA